MFANTLSSFSILLGYSELSPTQLQATEAFHFQLQQLKPFFLHAFFSPTPIFFSKNHWAHKGAALHRSGCCCCHCCCCGSFKTRQLFPPHFLSGNVFVLKKEKKCSAFRVLIIINKKKKNQVNYD